VLNVLDATGRCVYAHRLVQGTNEIDVRSLASGIYTCEVRAARTRYTGRLIKD
jgi:hypothetical protein